MTVRRFAKWYGEGWQEFLESCGVKYRRQTDKLEPILAKTLMHHANGQIEG